MSLWGGNYQVRTTIALHAWAKRPAAPRGSPRALVRLAEDYAKFNGLTLADLTGPERSQSVARVRQAFMHAAYMTGKYSYPEIGRLLKRDHTTILHGVRAHRARMTFA